MKLGIMDKIKLKSMIVFLNNRANRIKSLSKGNVTTHTFEETDWKETALEQARQSGDPFRLSPYFDEAESAITWQWDMIWPMIKDLDMSCVLDLAAGHGRNSARLRLHTNKLILVDINEECIEACRTRFKGDTNIVFIRNDGISLSRVESESVTLIYCFDSMVHFDNEVIKAYMPEFFRVLKPGGHGFFHHSNYTANPGGDFRENPQWRNFMSKELFAHYSIRAGLDVVQQKVIDWAYPEIDCLTLLQKRI